MPTVSSDLLRNALASAADSSGRQTNPKHWPGMGRFPQHTFLTTWRESLHEPQATWSSAWKTGAKGGRAWPRRQGQPAPTGLLAMGPVWPKPAKAPQKMKSGKDAGKLAEF